MVSVTKIEISVTKIRGFSYRTIAIALIFERLTDLYPLLNPYITLILTPKATIGGELWNLAAKLLDTLFSPPYVPPGRSPEPEPIGGIG